MEYNEGSFAWADHLLPWGGASSPLSLQFIYFCPFSLFPCGPHRFFYCMGHWTPPFAARRVRDAWLPSFAPGSSSLHPLELSLCTALLPVCIPHWSADGRVPHAPVAGWRGPAPRRHASDFWGRSLQPPLAQCSASSASAGLGASCSPYTAVH